MSKDFLFHILRFKIVEFSEKAIFTIRISKYYEVEKLVIIDTHEILLVQKVNFDFTNRKLQKWFAYKPIYHKKGNF